MDFGIGERTDLGIVLSFLIQYGGFLDPFLQAYHKLFGFNNQDRELVQDNRFRLKVENENGLWLDLDQPACGLGDIIFKGKLNIVDLPEQGFFVALQPAVKLPIGSTRAFLSSGKVDFALNLLVEKSIYRFLLYLNCGWMHLGKPDDLSIFGFNGNLFSYALAVEWIVSASWSLYVQVDGNTSPYDSGHRWLDKHSSTINFGFKYRFSPEMYLQLSLAEEFWAFATTDVSLMAALIFNF